MARLTCAKDFRADPLLQNGLVGKYMPSRAVAAPEPPSGSSSFLMSSLKLIALMDPVAELFVNEDLERRTVDGDQREAQAGAFVDGLEREVFAGHRTARCCPHCG